MATRARPRTRPARVAGVVPVVLLAWVSAGVVSRWVDLPMPGLAVLPSLVPALEVLVLAVVALAAWRYRRLALVGLVPAAVSAGLLVTPLAPHSGG